MRPDTTAVRDRILAVLREATTEMTANQIAHCAGDFVMAFPGGCRPETHASPRHLWCANGACYIRAPLSLGNRAYRELSALARLGAVRRTSHHHRGTRTVSWALVASTVRPVALLDIEAIWNA